MSYKRSAGILLHPTSLPGPDGIGDLGPDAHQWLWMLHEMGFGLWQILPLGPTGYGDSPYQCFSAFAGNPLLVNPLFLVDEELLTLEDLSDRPIFPADKVNYGEVIQWKNNLLNHAFSRFQVSPHHVLKSEFEEFCQMKSHWLNDYTLFMAIKDANKGKPWNLWPKSLKMRAANTLQSFTNEHLEDIRCHQFRQFLFFHQWKEIKQYANQLGIQIIGDVPIFVAYDSADAWSHPELFCFDENRDPTVVAGVPPDYFAATGQRWGNPLFCWDAHRKDGFAWWTERIKATLQQVDLIRLDHFRGFVDYWEIPAGMPTAEMGAWKPGPGKAFLKTLEHQVGGLPVIAEDLGQINPDVYRIRDEMGLPGMKILQFGFGNGPDDDFLPHNYPPNCVAYTGTHDNDTSIGWYETATENERHYLHRYLNASGKDVAWDLIRSVWASVATFAIAPLQDFLRLGTHARMNYPGQPYGNWTWRFQAGDINEKMKHAISEINNLYGRKVKR